ncbi:MAG TPA: long-chain fatty acid--CoA ligase [Pseudonocardiaceae bacterium]|nr:long-chain fatty acid--CoA ligase [Pseudonocardiaceae bacterium]
MNVATILQMAADGYPDRTAVGPRVAGISYRKLWRLVASGAARIDADTEAVVFVGQSGLAFVTAFFASAALGISFVPLNYRLGEQQLGALLDEHANALIIADPRQRAAIPDAGRTLVTTDQWLAALFDEDRELEIAEPNTPALYLYTSGTNAAPKAAILHHRHLAAYIFSSIEFGSAEAGDAALVSVPPYHIAGVANLLSNVFSGRRVVYLPDFTPKTWLATVRAEGITQAMVVPTMLARVVEEIGAGVADAPALRSLSYGGARMHESVLRRALLAFPEVGFVNAYGLTETSSSIAVLGPEDHRAALTSDDPALARRLSSVGRALPGVEIEIRDGDVWVRGEQVSGEYAGQVSVCDANGWFPTRDAGWLDDEGYLFIEGRTDDTIIRGGENIAPAEIEDVLLRHPAVLEAAVVGLPDEEWGQKVAAAVTVRPGMAAEPDELCAWTRKHLRGSRAAELVVIRDALPRNDTGKLLRRQVLADLLETTAS